MTLLSHAQTAYALTAQDEQTIADAIAKAYIVSVTAAYRKAGHTTKAKGTATWSPSNAETDKAQKWATEQARSITETYHGMLQRMLEKVLHEKGEREKDWQDEYDSLDEAIAALDLEMGDWFDSLSEWKPDQIANSTCGQGADDGLALFLVALIAGELLSSTTGEVIQLGNFAIAVLPGGAKCPECQEWAGGTYDLMDDSVPPFPIHSGCTHARELVMI